MASAERGGAVALVVVGHGSATSLLVGQGARKRLLGASILSLCCYPSRNENPADLLSIQREPPRQYTEYKRPEALQHRSPDKMNWMFLAAAPLASCLLRLVSDLCLR